MEHEHHHVDLGKELKKFYSLVVLISVIALISNIGSFNVNEIMSTFMGLSFLMLGFAKFLDYENAVETFTRYDLVAQKVKAYAYFYPFIELGLGASYLFGFWPSGRNWVALAVLSVGTYGIKKMLAQPGHIECACLGKLIKLPLSKISYYEDMVMAIMAAVMLVLSYL